MKTLYVERFTLQKFLDNFLTDQHIQMFKESLDLYKSTTTDLRNELIIQDLEFLINGSHKDKITYHRSDFASRFFEYIYDCGILSNMYKILNKAPTEWMKSSKKYYDYFMQLCDREDNKLYWQKKSIHQQYENEDIIITDPCYFHNEKTIIDMMADTIYGDWSCTCFNKDTKQPIGKFCADGGTVCVAKLKDVLKDNPNFEQWMKEHDWCVTLIKNFTGTVSIIYDIEEFEYEGKLDKDLYCYLEGKGNINFTTRQTGF